MTMTTATHCITVEVGNRAFPAVVPIAAGTLEQCQQLADLLMAMSSPVWRNPGNGEAGYMVASPDYPINPEVRALGAADAPYVVEI